MNSCGTRIVSVLVMLFPCMAYAQPITYVSQTRYVQGFDQVDFDNPLECRIDAADFSEFNAQCGGVGPSGTVFGTAASQSSSLTSSGFVVDGSSAGDSFDGVGQSYFEVVFDVDHAASFDLSVSQSICKKKGMSQSANPTIANTEHKA